MLTSNSTNESVFYFLIYLMYEFEKAINNIIYNAGNAY